MNSNSLKKGFWYFVSSMSVLLAIVFGMTSAFLIMKDKQNTDMIRFLAEQRNLDKAQIEKLSVALYQSNNALIAAKNDANLVKAKLDNALIPESNVQQAFEVHIAKPVSESFTEAWKEVSSSSKKAWNYVFN